MTFTATMYHDAVNLTPQNIDRYSSKVPRAKKMEMRLDASAISVANSFVDDTQTGDRHMFITTLETPVFAIRPIPVTIQKIDDSFVASFEDANIHISGDTSDDALTNLKYLISDLFIDLDDLPAEQLGPAVQRQIETMRRFMGKWIDAR